MVALVGYVAAALVIGTVLSSGLGGLTVAIGAASAGVAFALKEVIVSIAGGIAISFGVFYEIGDRVQLGGIQGDVIDIGVVRTTIMKMGQWIKADLYNGRIVRVANLVRMAMASEHGRLPCVHRSGSTRPETILGAGAEERQQC